MKKEKIITELEKQIKECENEIKAEKNIKDREYLMGYTSGTRDALSLVRQLEII